MLFRVLMGKSISVPLFSNHLLRPNLLITYVPLRFPLWLLGASGRLRTEVDATGRED